MDRTVVASLTAYMRLGVWVCAFAAFSVVSAPTLLADPIYDFDFYAHSHIVSATPSGSAHPEHDSLIFKNSLLSEESSFSADPSLLGPFAHEDHWLPGDSLADQGSHGLHLGWGKGVEHNHHHHYGGDPTKGNIDLSTGAEADPVAGPEPSTAAAILSGLAIVLFFSFRKRVSA